MLEEVATLLKSAMFSIMLTLGASRATKVGPTASRKRKGLISKGNENGH